MQNKEFQQRVLDHVNREDYRPVKPRVIAKQLGLPASELPNLKKVIKRLVKSGQIKYGPKHLILSVLERPKKRSTKKPVAAAVAPADPDRQSGKARSPEESARPREGKDIWASSTRNSKADKAKADKTRSEKTKSDRGKGPKKRSGRKLKSNEVIGRFSKAAGGYGFVAVAPSESDGPEASPRDDIYVPQRQTLDAATGDVVRVQVESRAGRRKGDRQKVSGRVVEIVERRTHRFVGTYVERGEYGMVTIDGNQFDSDVLVGDAGAKACRIGDKVVVEMVRFPGAHINGNYQQGEAVIVQVLGDRGQPGVDTLTVIAEFGLPGDFPGEVLDVARGQAEEFDESIGDRTDFTGDTVVTIDPKTARDFDDAISLRKIEKGHWQLGVHIADVSHFVQPNTELDHEAYRRATSIYLPDRVIPMLPEVISNNLASLQPDRIRYCMTAVIEFNAEGVPIGTELHRAAIKSCHRFNYEEIDEYLEDDKPWKKKLTPEVFQLVRNMHTLAMILRKRRMKRGSFDLAIPEVRIDLDEDGRVSGASVRENTESHQVIEEFMLAANEAVAQHLVDKDYYLMRRIHENPSPTKLKDLKTIIKDLGYKASNFESRFELKRIIEESRDSPESHTIHFAILRAMPKAVYTPKEIGHYALASKAYCHFTSPIRRYPDLIIHRMLGALIDGKKPISDFATLQRWGTHCSDLEQRAERAERELVKLKLINFLSDKIGMRMDAVVSGVESYGLFAQGKELPANGFIPIESLPRDKYVFDRATRTLVGHRTGNKYRLGDPIRIRVVSADPDRREIEFGLENPKLKRHLTASEPQSSRPSKKGDFKKATGKKPRRDKNVYGKEKSSEKKSVDNESPRKHK